MVISGTMSACFISETIEQISMKFGVESLTLTSFQFIESRNSQTALKKT
jgi:hypothetical protein